ncbi:HPP family protein [Nisaea denitrificans]|uniref:HPP family protein n=1 Tax=Nisaea denitrificans TaxID=390877 RepID=UPI000491B5E0|nr:HPP family protein [Nisaea denitrificans]
MPTLLGKMIGGGACPEPARPAAALLSGLGAMLAIGFAAGLSEMLDAMLMMAPFGASCFLAFALPQCPLAQPRNIVFGHLVSSLVGLAVLAILGPEWPGMALAVGLAISAMMWTGTGHAPAGADPVVIFVLQPGPAFLLTPVLSGALLIVVVALLFNNLRPGKQYPVYW